MNILTLAQAEDIKLSGKILAQVLEAVRKKIEPGVNTLELDKLAEKLLKEHDCRPAFKGFPGPNGDFPGTLCTSINDEIVHGMPSKEVILKDGDVISIDIGAEFHGIYTDMAKTFAVGEISPGAQRLLSLTEESLYLGIKQATAGNHIGDIGNAIEELITKNGLGLIRDYVGHGIGTDLHLPPQIPNFGSPGTGMEIKEGMALAIEPMVTLGSGETVPGNDGWAVLSADGSVAAHFEHTILIENGKPTIITKL